MIFSIREMEIKDIPQVQYVAKTSWNTTYEGIIPLAIQAKFILVAYSDDMMHRRLNHSLMLVAETDDRVVGFANFSPVREGGDVELSAIYLLEEYQGNGIGTSLLQEGIKKLNLAKALFIHVEKENQIGRNFYTAKGFQVIKEFDDDFDGHILKTVRMELKL